MPLSEHEQRLLDEIEQTLRVDDPALASSLRSARPVIRTRLLLLGAVGGLIAGIALLIAGLRVHGFAGPVLGVAGFACIVAASDCGLRVVSRARETPPRSTAKR